MSFLVEARNVCREFVATGSTQLVLDSVNLTVQPGEFLAITGSSGSGKSTLLSVLAGIDRATSGAVFLDGRDITRLDEDQLAPIRNRLIGFVFQSFHLIPSLNVIENIMFPAELLADPDARKKAQSLMDKVGLSSRSGNFPRQLSGGEQQRVAICRAVINEPKIIFADEPTGNLDSANSDGVLGLLTTLQKEKGASLIMATHSMKIAATADRIVKIVDGRIATAETSHDEL